MGRIAGLDRQGAAGRALASLAGAAGWALLGALGCGESHDPLTGRCLEALAYQAPSHGRVEEIERGPSADGWKVTIRHATSDDALAGRFTCEYEVGDRWRFKRIAVGERELVESELALVNSELFLRDLSRSPQRFEERAAEPAPEAPGDAVSAAPPERR